MSFASVLVANRGEIALRVGRTLGAMGLRWLAVHAPDEAGAPHVRAAMRAAAVASYLDIPGLIDAARALGAEAVHPGYGFLSENAEFAEAVIGAGLVWIGPPPDAMRLMADKGAAKAAMAASGVPVLPGHDGAEQSDAALIAAAGAVGFPLMVKAAAGGGGRGMRLVAASDALPEALVRARSEAVKAFGNGRLILERAVTGARHVELQILADAHGGVIHLGERDCSVQRRHQKLVEEAPCPAVTEGLRARLGAAAVAAARACGYRGAGTVEFLLSGADFHFLEMNTRLQVEHPVTEAVTGLDLVEWQIRVARGEALPAQDATSLTGHAIEVRLCAEDPGQGFLPQTGRLLDWAPPACIRSDHALEPGLVIGAGYDSMLAKLIAHGPDRETARRRLIAALDGLRITGLVTNRAFLAAVLAHPVFAAGAATTGFLDQDFAADPSLTPSPPSPRALLLAAALFAGRAAGAQGLGHPRFGWTNGPAMARRMRLEAAGVAHDVTLRLSPAPGGGVTAQGAGVTLTLVPAGGGAVQVTKDAVSDVVRPAWDGGTLWLGEQALRDVTHAPAARGGGGAGDGLVCAPMAGALIALPVAEGAVVAAGQVLAVIEAMKMEHPVRAPRAGRVSGLAARQGQQLAAGQVLMRIEEAE